VVITSGCSYGYSYIPRFGFSLLCSYYFFHGKGKFFL